MTTYCGTIGSVNVLAIMSTDLFDESQENPFLLQQQSPSPRKSPTRASSVQQWPVVSSGSDQGLDLPLADQAVGYTYRAPESYPGASLTKQQPLTPQQSPTRSVSFAAAPRGILKRQTSLDSEPLTVPSLHDQQTPDLTATESELHKLLYSMTRFGLANDASSQRGAPAFSDALRDEPLASVAEAEVSSVDGSVDASLGRRASRPATAKRRRSSKKSSGRPDPMPRSRGSVSFAVVKNLLRGGGLAGRTAIQKQPESAHRKKSMGTVSSRLKINQKFQRPTILTDAYHRVSDMKLGTRPLPVAAKHIAFPDTWQGDVAEREEADAGMPSPKGQLKRDSCITLETLDKIGTRAACPVHLLEEDTPDYSRVRARVDSYNHVRSPKRGLRRPSTWLAGAALDARVANYETD
ncbi:hypothetical protein BBJ28_00009692 [Nothophytophthora sp. Chile5]|nr:hypothetical protein BBJ28_00009692 [Nothophytophthora sp. Chile5]